MRYDLKRPCAKCPFRNDIEPYITSQRCVEILNSEGFFPCHETTRTCDDDLSDANSDGDDTDMSHEALQEWQHCVGMLIILEKEDRPNNTMRIAERLFLYDRRQLDMESSVYPSIHEAMRAHVLQEDKRKRRNTKRETRHGGSYGSTKKIRRSAR